MFKKVISFIAGLFSHKQTTATAEPTSNQSGPSTTTTTTTTTTQTPAEIAQEDVQKAIDIVNNVKSALSSPVAVLITDIIPSNIDNTIRENLVSLLPKVAAGLTFLKEALSGDMSTALNQVLQNIKFSDDANLNAFYHTLAAKVLMIITDGKVSWSKAVLAVEYVLKEAVLNGPDTSAPILPAQPAAPAILAPVATQVAAAPVQVAQAPAAN